MLVSLPGQLYDYESSKTDNVIAGKRNEDGGGEPGPVDADQEGKFCEWWLMEINRPFERWHVLARMEYKDLPARTVYFSDLGLAPEKEYLVFEQRSGQFLGSYKEGFAARAQKARDVSAYVIRENSGRPQLLATSRHITGGGPDIEGLQQGQSAISGKSLLVANDPYRIDIYLPAGYALESVKARGARVVARQQLGNVASVTLRADRTGAVAWKIQTRGSER